MFDKTSTRLNKYISESGICSRRDADRFIEQGNVFINGRRAKVGDQVAAGDRVKVNGQDIEAREEDDLVLIAVNKPVGIVCTTESGEKGNIVDFVRHSTRIFPIGRLDKDSQGLIFLTNNGDLVNKILRAGNNHEKEYRVTVNRPVTEEFIAGMGAGVPILGTKTKKCKVVKISPYVFTLTLVQGLNRQIRRMCDYFNYDVVQLERVRVMNISIKGLALGEWRDFKPKESKELFALLEASSSEASSSPRKGKSKPKRPAGGYWSERSSKNEVSRGGTKRSAAGKPASGKPASGKPASGKSASGRSAPGKPAAGPSNSTRGGKVAGASKTSRSGKAGKSTGENRSARPGRPSRPATGRSGDRGGRSGR